MMSGVSERPAIVVGGLAACGAGFAAYGLYCLYNSKRPQTGTRKWREVGKVSTLFIHPVKSCRGIEVPEAQCTALGMKSSAEIYDRHYAILDDGDHMVSMRQISALALIHPSQSDDGKYLQLDAPDMPTLKIPLYQAVTRDIVKFRLWRVDAEGYNCGEEVAKWLDTFLKTTGYKLVYYLPDLQPCKNVEHPTWGTRQGANDKSIYQDFAQYLLFSQASLDHVNSKLEKKVTKRNFRPNIVVEGVDAFEEDNWKFVRLGEKVVLRKTHLCGRCKMITVDPETGIANDEPLKTLKAFRVVEPSHPDHKGLAGAPVFGININVDVEGTVSVGDSVYISDY